MEQQLTSNPVLQGLNLILGCLYMILSFSILLHIIVYELVSVSGNPKNEFLNDLL